jgi:UDP-2,3-diacylglucosamine pyrophosphatase LpxH
LHQLELLAGSLNDDTYAIVMQTDHKALNYIADFIAELKDQNFSTTAIYDEEQPWTIHKIINKYNKFMRLLFMALSHQEQNRMLYIVANNFFMYCFDPGNKLMETLVAQSQYELIARMMYAVMWKHLGSRGWQSWHQEIINQLKDKAADGNEIVYIAGGSDINQLLKNRMYNLRVIDPFLPTQDTYYSSGWRFLVQGCIGDTIEWPFDTHTVFLKRTLYQEHGSFMAELSNGKKRRVPDATIVWAIYNKDQQKLGQLTIDRRFTTQGDFVHAQNKTVLISFNELYFITTLREDGWGIDVDQLDSGFKVYVKQLSKPLPKKMLLRMREVDDKFDFIQLGNCIN